ncbi:DUF3008 family protein [Haliscomenobacter sp.]|uniref:DUF3008 family protein n=1 Tax=Haliscomenobacter sp. TaxID=2717303 RepID=UPI00336507CD
MTFFYDLNKKLDSIRATPEVKTQQLNEQVSSLTKILNERATKEGMGFLGEKDVEEAYNPNSIGAENRRGLDASHAANLRKKAAAGDAKAQAALQHLKDKKERMSNDFNARMERESAGMDESALQAAFGIKKYTKPGMEKLQQLGREGASEKTKAAARKKFDQYDESIDEGDFKPDFLDIDKDGNTTEPMKSAARGVRDVDEAAKYRDAKYKDKLYTQEPPEADRDDSEDVYYNRVKPDDYQGAKRRMGGVGDEYERTDPLTKGFRYSAKNSINTHGKRKGLPSRDQISSLKSSIKAAKGTHTEPNLPEDQGSIPMTPKQQKFAKLAKPFDKITFADKIVGAKKEVDEMLGDVAAEAMRSALSPKQKKLDRNHNGKLDATDFAMLRKGAKQGRNSDMEEASTGNAFDYKNFKQPEKQKPTSFVHKGTYGTEYDGDKEDAKAIRTKKQAAAAAGQGSRGRGRPKNNASADTGEVMKPDFSAFGDKVKLKPFTGKITRNKMVGEDDLDPKDQGEYDQEGDMAKDQIKTVVRHAQALEKILGDDDNLPEWVQSKLAKIETMMTAVDDYMQNQQDDDMDMDDEQEPIAEKAVSKKQQRFMGMVSAAKKGEKPASKEVANVAKTMKKSDAEDFASTKHKGLPEKAAKKTKEVDETTSSGSVATSDSAAPKSSGGMSYGKGIYDSLNRKLEDMISESMNINMSMNNDDHGGPSRSLTVTATDEDATALASMLRMAGMGGGNDHMPHMNNGVVQPDQIKIMDFDDGTDDLAAELSNELHGGHDSDHSDTCPTCGSSDCGCDNSDTMDEAYGDTDATENHPDYPTEAEGTDDAMMYSGGIDGPKSTGQSTVPVIASQQDRQHAYEDAAALRRMMEMAGLPVAEAAPPVKLATPQHVDEPVSPASAAAAADKKPVVKPVTKSATPQAVDEPVKPVKEDQMAHSLMRELHNFKY